jgi:hypothetical protein
MDSGVELRECPALWGGIGARETRIGDFSRSSLASVPERDTSKGDRLWLWIGDPGVGIGISLSECP